MHAGTLERHSGPPSNPEFEGFTELGRGQEPPPLEWLTEGLIPEGHATILSGDGGLGKSYVALYIGSCVLLGRAFLGRPVKSGAVLWIDAEGMGQDEVERRFFEVARGMGLQQPPWHLHYYRPTSGLGDRLVQTRVQEAIRGLDVKLAILDSFSMGAAGSDVSSQRDTVDLLRSIQEWDTTCLLLDHIAKAASQGNHAQATIFGSVFKRNGARSTLKLVGREGNVRELLQDKSNFGPNTGGTRYEMVFESDKEGRKVVRFKDQGAAQPQPEKVKKRTKDVTLDVLKELSEDGKPVAATDIAAERGLTVKAVRNHLSELAAENCVMPCGDGTYSLSVKEEEADAL